MNLIPTSILFAGIPNPIVLPRGVNEVLINHFQNSSSFDKRQGRFTTKPRVVERTLGILQFKHPTPTGLHNVRNLWNPDGVQPCNIDEPRVRVATLGFVVEPRCGSHPLIGNYPGEML